MFGFNFIVFFSWCLIFSPSCKRTHVAFTYDLTLEGGWLFVTEHPGTGTMALLLAVEHKRHRRLSKTGVNLDNCLPQRTKIVLIDLTFLSNTYLTEKSDTDFQLA